MTIRQPLRREMPPPYPSSIQILSPRPGGTLARLRSIEGTGLPGDRVTLLLDWYPALETSAGSDGRFCVPSPYELKPGAHVLRVRSDKDRYGILYIRFWIGP